MNTVLRGVGMEVENHWFEEKSRAGLYGPARPWIFNIYDLKQASGLTGRRANAVLPGEFFSHCCNR
jgi:hypothetical protein